MLSSTRDKGSNALSARVFDLISDDGELCLVLNVIVPRSM